MREASRALGLGGQRVAQGLVVERHLREGPAEARELLRPQVVEVGRQHFGHLLPCVYITEASIYIQILYSIDIL